MILQTIVKFFFASAIILLIVWNRFLRTRTEISLDDIHINTWKICIIIFIIILNIFLIYISIKQILNLKGESKIWLQIKQHCIFIKIQEIFQEYILHSPKYLYKKIIRNITLGKILEYPVSYITAYFNYPQIIGICFLLLPRAFVATTFLVDIFYFKQLKYFLISLSLLILPLLANIFLFIINEYSKSHYEAIEKHLFLEKNPEGNILLSLKPENLQPFETDPFFVPYNILQERFKLLCQYWDIYRSIHIYMYNINAVRDYFNKYFTIYTSICYVLGWSFYLFIILFHF